MKLIDTFGFLFEFKGQSSASFFRKLESYIFENSQTILKHIDGVLLIKFSGRKIWKRKTDVALKFILHKNCKHCLIVAKVFFGKNQFGFRMYFYKIREMMKNIENTLGFHDELIHSFKIFRGSH